MKGDFSNTRIVVVSLHADKQIGVGLWLNDASVPVHLVRPKPNVWNGEHRLTKENWFAASSARNTGLCLAPDGWILYVDDLSVLMPGYMDFVFQAVTQSPRVYLGSYRKVKNLVVEHGKVVSFDMDDYSGVDSRWRIGMDDKPVPCNGNLLYGCSVLMPVDALLSVGGWPELCDGLSAEDYVLGQALANAGFQFSYCRQMLTLESEEGHHAEPSFRRESFEHHPHDHADKGHAVLNMVNGGLKYFYNYYEGGIRKMREEVLSGKPFPIVQIPDRCWHTGRLLSEL